LGAGHWRWGRNRAGFRLRGRGRGRGRASDRGCRRRLRAWSGCRGRGWLRSRLGWARVGIRSRSVARRFRLRQSVEQAERSSNLGDSDRLGVINVDHLVATDVDRLAEINCHVYHLGAGDGHSDGNRCRDGADAARRLTVLEVRNSGTEFLRRLQGSLLRKDEVWFIRRKRAPLHDLIAGILPFTILMFPNVSAPQANVLPDRNVPRGVAPPQV